MKRTVRASAPDNKTYEIQRIIKHRGDSLKDYEYEVKWKGYPTSDNEWLTAESFVGAKKMLEDYQKKNGLTAKKKTMVVVLDSDSGEDDDNLEKEDEEEKEEEEQEEEKEGSDGEEEGSDDEETYEVSAIVSHRKIRGGQIKYMVSWKGYPSSDNSEMIEEELEGAPELLAAYKKKHGIEDKKATPPASDRRTRTAEKKKSEASSSGTSSSRTRASNKRPASPVASSAKKTRSARESGANNKRDSSHSESPARKSPSQSPSPPPSRSRMQVRRSLGGPADMRQPSRSSSRSLSPASRFPQTARMSTGGRAPKSYRQLSPPVSSRSSRSPILDVTPRRQQADLPARRSFSARNGTGDERSESPVDREKMKSPGKSPVKVMPKRACNFIPPKHKYGIAEGLEVEQAISAWSDQETKAIWVKVTYKDPIPAGLVKRESVPSHLLHDKCPKLLLDLYEGMMSG